MARRRPTQRTPLSVFYETVRSSEYDDAGFLGIQVDADGLAGGGQLEAQVAHQETLHPYGFFSRPPAADVDGSGDVSAGCGTLLLEDGSDDFTFALGDSRVVPILATTQFGESIQYGAAANFVRCHADGRVTRFATHDGTPNGQSVYDQIGPEGYLGKTPWSVLRNDATGLHFEHISGAHFDLGSIAGLPEPFSAFSTWAELQAHVIRIKGSAIQLGVGAGAQPVALATTTLANDGSLSSALALVQAALTALGAIGVNNAAGPAIAASAAAVAAAASAISASAATLPSKSTTAT